MVVPYGFGIGDFVAISTLAVNVYKKCRDSPGQYKDLASDARQLANLLQDLDDLVRQRRLPASQESELVDKAYGCREVLTDIDALVDKYNALGTKSRWTWDRLRWDQSDARDLRARLTSAVVMVSAFYNGLISSTIFRLETALQNYIEEVQTGKRDATSVSSLEQPGSEEMGWAQIVKDLEEMGVSKAAVSENAALIKERLRKAIANGELSPATTSHIDTCEVPILIALMGATGVGKSTFIRIASYEENDTIQNNVEKYDMASGISSTTTEVSGHKVVLIDVPGYHDTFRPVDDMRKLVADYLETNFGADANLSGILFLEKASNRARYFRTLSEQSSLFRSLLGSGAFNRVVVTLILRYDMEDIDGQDLDTDKIQQRVARNEFWARMIERGVRFAQFYNTQQSAHDVIRMLL